MRHFSHDELACPATNVVKLADGFEEYFAGAAIASAIPAIRRSFGL